MSFNIQKQPNDILKLLNMRVKKLGKTIDVKKKVVQTGFIPLCNNFYLGTPK